MLSNGEGATSPAIINPDQIDYALPSTCEQGLREDDMLGRIEQGKRGTNSRVA